MSDDPARDVVSENDTSWCTAEPFSEGDAPYIMFNFTERVMLTYMRARGATELSYVTEFSLDYREKDSQNFTPYTLITNEEHVSEHINSYLYVPPKGGSLFIRFGVVDGMYKMIISCGGNPSIIYVPVCIFVSTITI